MAIAFVANAEQDGGASAVGSITVTINTGAGADFIAFGAIQYAANTITGVTINGVDVSANVIQQDFATAGAFYYGLGSYSGNIACVMTWSAANAVAIGAAVAYSGVDSGTPYSGFVENLTNESTDEQVTVTSETDDVVLFGMMASADSNYTYTISGSSSPTEREQLALRRMVVAFGDDPGAASVVGGWSASVTPEYGRNTWGISLNPSGAGAATWGPLLAGQNNRLVRF